MSVLTILMTALRLWFTYGDLAERVIGVVQDLAALENGGFFQKFEQILAGRGFDVSQITEGGAPGFTDVRVIQAALNLAATSPAIPVTGVLDGPTREATAMFQRVKGLEVDGIPGQDTIDQLKLVPGASAIVSPVSVSPVSAKGLTS